MKLHGFLRISKNQPAPVIPVFSEENGKIFVQSINSEHKIVSFNDVIPERSRIIFEDNRKYPEKSIGDLALYAVEYKEKSITYGDISKIKGYIIELHKKNTFSRNPFTLLELARLANIENLVETAIRECGSALRKIDPDLERRWIMGADVDDAMKQDYLSRLEIEGDVGEIHLSFSAPYLALINLTEFSRHHMYSYRSRIFREAIDHTIQYGLDFINNNNMTLLSKAFIHSISAGRKLGSKEQLNLHSMTFRQESRGNIKLSLDDYYKFIDEISTISISMFSAESIPSDYRMLIYYYFFENRSKLTILAMYLYYIGSFPDFADFIMERKFLLQDGVS